jgi:glutathione S-transferase
MTPLTLYSAWYCPFAQRAWMTLLHKGIAFDYNEVDPYESSDWWLEISRGRSTVPVVVVPAEDGGPSLTVVDSTRVVEYLDERSPDSDPLFAADLATRTEQRFWVDHINERIVPHLYGLLRPADAGEQQDASRKALLDGLEAFANALSEQGPFFAGTKMTAIDLLMIPFAYRIDALLGHYRGFAVPADGETWQRYARWFEHMCQLEAFKATSTDHDDYRGRLIEKYRPFSEGKTAP